MNKIIQFVIVIIGVILFLTAIFALNETGITPEMYIERIVSALFGLVIIFFGLYIYPNKKNN